MVEAVYAVLKAGGGYVPLDPAYPADRLAFMISDSRMPVLLTQGKWGVSPPGHEADVVAMDAVRDTISTEN